MYRRLKEAGKDAWFEHNPETEFSDTLLCAGLVHDIGNPPFGHFGEYAVREWFQRYLGGMTDNYARRLYRELFSWTGRSQSGLRTTGQSVNCNAWNDDEQLFDLLLWY
ncbi:MAG: HD domain-containing protein [Hungatella sp.]|nr:HD domain-containing protein [Hungatella sp.]